MEVDDIELTNLEEYSKELTWTLKAIVRYIDNHGVTSDPTDAPAYWLLDRLMNAEGLVEEFISRWPNHDVTEAPNGGSHQMYYLAKLHSKYGDKPIGEVVRQIGLLKQFRNAQMRSGRIRVDEGYLHGLGFRGLLAIAPESDVTREAIKNIVRRYNSGRNSVDDRVMAESALGLLEYDYESYQEVINSTTERIAEKIRNDVESGTGMYLKSTDILLLAKNPLHTSSNIRPTISLLYADRMKEVFEIHELGYYAEIGVAMLAAEHGPRESSFHADWRATLREQRRRRQLPKFVSTQPATAVDNRRTDIKQQIEYIIEETQESLYVSTRGIGMLHHDILDLLEENPDLDFRVLTNRKRASGDRKKFKRAAMDEIAKRTGTGVKQSKLLHARMVISDEQRLLVSNADFTRDQLHDSFNAGIYSEHIKTVKSAVEMFETAWESGQHFNPS